LVVAFLTNPRRFSMSKQIPEMKTFETKVKKGDDERLDFEEYFSEMKRCTKCILPETFPGIEFGNEGVCNYCRGYKPVEVFGAEAFEQVLDRYRNSDGKYDCVVPFSGGRDSSFVLHQMVKRFNMNVLALTVDSGAIMPEGYNNIEKAVGVLGVDHVWLKDENQIRAAKENTKTKFHAWLKKPSINMIVPVLNAGDKTMNLRIYKHANENGIRLVLGGNNVGNSSFEQEHFKTGFLGVFPNERGMYSWIDKTKLSFLLGLEYFKNWRNLRWSIFKEYVKGFYVYLFESLSKPEGIVPLGFYDYIYWNEKEVISTIRRELGWQGAEDTTATWRVDDSMYPLIDYLYYRLVGFTEFDEHYSKLIREGQDVSITTLHEFLL
jgi:glucosamine--fructose-6-phosphate aminotransferase (isomerizing)